MPACYYSSSLSPLKYTINKNKNTSTTAGTAIIIITRFDKEVSIIIPSSIFLVSWPNSIHIAAFAANKKIA